MTNPFAVEPLEPRRLLSITWVNRGKADNFDAMYKGSAKVARQIVDAAIADWNKALPKANAKLRISAFDIEAGQRQQNTLGRTDGTTIQLDKDGAGHRWYFDPDLADDSDFSASKARSPFHATGSVTGADFYSVVAHELGHALGFVDTKTPFSRSLGVQVYRDAHHANDVNDLMYPALSEGGGGRRLITPYDIAHTTAGRSIKYPVAPRSYFAATATTGAPLLSLTWTRGGVQGPLTIYRATRAGASWQAAGAQVLATTGSTQTSYIDATAEPGKTYYYFVVPASGAATGYSAAATGVRGTGSPVSTSADPAADGIHLNWSVNPGATTLSVYRSTADGSDPVAAGATLIARFTPTASSPLPAAWTDPGVAPNVTYHYWLVGTYDLTGKGQLTEFTSAAAVATSLSVYPSAVQVFADSASYSPYLRVSWTPVTGATSYDVYHSTTDAGSPEASGATVWQTGLRSPDEVIADGNAGWGKGWYWWVVARFGAGADAPTYVYPPGRGYLMKPTENNSAAATFDKAAIEITLAQQYYFDVGGVDHFDIYRSLTYSGTRQASGAQLVGTLPGDAAANRGKFYDFGAPHDVNVYYWVTAVYKPFPDVTITHELPPVAGTRPASDMFDYVPASSVVASKGTSRNTIDLTWQPVAGAGGYDIFVNYENFTTTLGHPEVAALHVSDPTTSHATLGTSAFPADGYNPAGPRAGFIYRIWVVATPGPGLASPQELGFDRGYVNAINASEGLPQGIRVSFSSSNYGYGFKLFRSTSPTASPTTGGLTYIGDHDSGYIDTDTVPGVTYYYWAFNSGFDSLSLPVWGSDSGYRV